MKAYKSTAAQARYCEFLASEVGREKFVDLYAKAARLNGNKHTGAGETVTQAVRRLSKKAASSLIASLIEANK